MAQQDAAEQIERIKQRAYEIWEAEGRPDGKNMEHWAQAEGEIAGSIIFPGTVPPAGSHRHIGRRSGEARLLRQA